MSEAYQVLARRWRPKNFHQLVGQTHVTQALTYALDHNRIHHAYLFTGTRGVGKTTIARIFAKSLNCKTRGVSSEPCGECEHCREIDEGRFPDLIEVDAASRSRVEETRELLDNIPYAPVKGNYKVYLIDEVHMFSASSFNALLKTLEEPPEHVKFILATTDPQKLPATILSRCLQFHLKNMSERQISDHLAHILDSENAAYDRDALQLLANAAAGSMRDSLSLLDQALAYGQGEVRSRDVATLLGAVPEPQLNQMLHLLADGNAAGLRQILDALDEYAPDYANLLLRLLQQIQKITIVRLNAERYPGEIPAELHALAARLPVELVQLWYQIGGDTWQNLPYQPDARMALEMSLLRMIALQPLLPDAEPPQAPTIREAAPATAADNLTAILQDSLPSGTTAASADTDNSAQPEPTASPSGITAASADTDNSAQPEPTASPSGETTASANTANSTQTEPTAPPSGITAASADTDNSAHTEPPALPSGTTPPLVAANTEEAPPPWEDLPAADDNDIPPWVSETIPDESVPAATAAEKKTAADATAADDAPSLDPLIDNLERWNDFLITLDLHEYPLLLLENSIPVAWQPPRLSLQTGAGGIIFDQKQNREEAAAAIAAKIGTACTIDIWPGDAVTTPIDYRRQKNAAQQQQAESDFHNHPQVQAAQAVFGDGLRVDNIQPTNPSQT